MFTQKKPKAQRVALVGCSAAKLKKSAPARELYTSALFRASYDYAETTCNATLIVSAFYGVVAPKSVISPYDRTLRQYTKREREDWGVRTIGQLLPSFTEPPQLVVLAGKLYADALAHGAHWHNLPRPEEPLRGIAGCGPRVTWLKANTQVVKVVEMQPEEAPRAGETTIDVIRAKIARLPLADRCDSACRTWGVFDTNHGPEIQACDACWHGVWKPLTDDEAALLPEAQAELAEQREEPPSAPPSTPTATSEVGS
jgi:hypothetical protein